MNESGEKLQKVLAQAGFGSRRLMEEWIAAGRVSVNGEPATLGMRVVEGDLVKAERRTIRVGARDHAVRVLLYHKPEGEIVSRDDPEKRASVFDKLPKLRGQKWVAVGRLDFNTSGLLIFTTSGELANCLMHPRFEVEREYAVRVQGTMTETQMDQALRQGVELEDGPVKFEKLEDQGGEGFNHWYRVMLKEGRNRVVRRTFDALGLPVSRLMRVRFGIVNLPPRLKRGMCAELGEAEVAQILDWAGMVADPDELQQAPSAPDHADRVRTAKTGHRPASVARTAGSARRTGGKSKTGIKR
ncbi:MAG: pseudouridine synthase [Gallionellales bacterium RIFCSPLOWO2_12_FULL_59_22]|nr:MAG: pseudouridine synthase [Gallionellales bacterium RIFCSPLOWO2_02_FULL_59_110]OGT04580.1 MAG: pseudouridine synthase [Gallionellales bacterium RIFCSPLOWO2_02_58_13]OGT11211.1 MAG: pseudouridine synthase [Gallionellales bacterium RIFCSPLOWO2_12_FULL_59_22]